LVKNYLLRRVAHSLLLLLSVSALSFLLLAMAPGDFFEEARLNARARPETIAVLRSRYGLAEPLPRRYARWALSVARGALEITLAYDLPASTLLGPRVANTLMLAVPSLAMAWAVALAAGIWSAAYPRKLVDRLTAFLSSALLAVPEVVLASLVLLWAARSGWLGSRGATWQRLAMAVSVLAAGMIPILLRHVRSAVKAASESASVAAARAHGITEARVWIRYTLPLAANPLISLLGLSIAGLVSSSLIVEFILGWPGLGPLLLDAIAARDVDLIMGSVLLSAVFLIAGNLAADLLLFVLDPRVSAQ